MQMRSPKNQTSSQESPGSLQYPLCLSGISAAKAFLAQTRDCAYADHANRNNWFFNLITSDIMTQGTPPIPKENDPIYTCIKITKLHMCVAKVTSYMNFKAKHSIVYSILHLGHLNSRSDITQDAILVFPTILLSVIIN